MPSVNDWAMEAARRICIEVNKLGPKVLEQNREERIAAIIALHAAPLVSLLQASRREHKTLSCAYIRWETRKCTCGADAWNARIDAALEGVKKP